jgi:hypothetical protein
MLLANENFPRIAVEALRARGHDVAWVRTEIPGASDEELIHRAAFLGATGIDLAGLPAGGAAPARGALTRGAFS